MADVSVTPASVQPGANALTKEGMSGVTIEAGQAVYKDTADQNKLKLADANAVSPANVLEGMALHRSLAGQPLEYQTLGEYTPGGALVKGTIYVLSSTPGGICPAADLASGHTVNIVGVASSTTVLDLRKWATGITV